MGAISRRSAWARGSVHFNISDLLPILVKRRHKKLLYFDRNALQRGIGPILMEPVDLEIAFPSNRTPRKVLILDHDGRRTGETLAVENGSVHFDGAAARTVYYEIEF